MLRFTYLVPGFTDGIVDFPEDFMVRICEPADASPWRVDAASTVLVGDKLCIDHHMSIPNCCVNPTREISAIDTV